MTKGSDQRTQIFSYFRSTDGEHQRLARMRQEAVDDTRNLGFVRNVTAGRSETGDVGSGWNNNRTLGMIIRVQAVLLGAFLRSAGYYQTCVLQHRFFGGDSRAPLFKRNLSD